jgi:hypothetical protein
MPSISDSRKIITTSIPSIPDSEVVLWDSLTMGDAEAISTIEDNTGKGIRALFSLVKSWNLDEKLTPDNFKKLSMTDFQFLLEQTSFWKDSQKKLEELEDEKAEKKTA